MSDEPVVSTDVGVNLTDVDDQAAFVEKMASRVREVAGLSRHNASSLSQALGIPSSTMANYWSGKRPWPVDAVPSLATVLQTNVDFLLTGRMGGLAGKFSAPLDRRYVISAEPDPDLVELDYVDLRFGLGGSYVDGPVTVEKQQFSRGWLEQITRSPPELLFWAETDGDSMEPTIRSGEIILGDRSQTTPRFGDGIWAIALGEIGMIKRLRPLPNGNVEIHSDNPVVPPAIAADGEMHVIGRVVAVVRRL